MIINNPVAQGMQVAVTGEVLRWKLIDIGAWDMDTVGIVNVLHGLDMNKIKHVSVLIYQDGFVGVNRLDQGPAINAVDGEYFLTATQVRLIRHAGGSFDFALWSNPVQNRGHIYIIYED